MIFFLRGFTFITVLGSLVGCTPSAPANKEISAVNSSRIIEGKDADENSPVIKNTVYLNLERGHYCTGVLLNDHVVLTAAHCVNHGTVTNITVMLPESSVPCSAVPVAEVAFPPTSPVTDVALVRLKTSLCSPTAPVVLEPSLKIGDIVSAAGLGDGSVGLDQIDLKLIPGDLPSLKKLYGGDKDFKWVKDSYAEFSASYTFTLAVNSNQSLCLGDSGGPVFREDNETLYIYGVIGGAFPHSTKGVPACQNSYLQFFAPTSPHIQWIQDQLKIW